jgi:hypothetical protein
MTAKSPNKINAVAKLTHPQGAFAYDKENEEKGAENRKLAVPYSGAPRLAKG